MRVRRACNRDWQRFENIIKGFEAEGLMRIYATSDNVYDNMGNVIGEIPLKVHVVFLIPKELVRYADEWVWERYMCYMNSTDKDAIDRNVKNDILSETSDEGMGVVWVEYEVNIRRGKN